MAAEWDGLKTLGWGLWQKWPVGWWFLEAALVLAGGAYYAVRAAELRTFGGRPILSIGFIALIHTVNSPLIAARGF